MKSITERAVRRATTFNWNKTRGIIAETFRMTEEEEARFSDSKTARLIAALPYIAGCIDAERTSLAHTAIYVLATRAGESAFDHCPNDNADAGARLRLIASFCGGNKAIIDRGMNLLKLQTLCGYNRDRAADAENGLYNPLNDGSWDFETMKDDLIKKISAIPCEEMEELFTIDDGVSVHWS